MNITFLRTGYELLRAPNSTTRPKFTIFECVLSICEKIYSQSRFSKGRLENTPTARESLEFGKCAGAWRRSASSSDMSRTPACAAAPSGQASDIRPDDYSSIPANSTVYWMDRAGLTAFQVSVIDALTNHVAGHNSASHEAVLPPVVAYASKNYYHGNFTLMMESISTGLTKQIWENPNTTKIRGAAWMPTIYVEVRWPWLAYPGSLVLLSIVFWTVPVRFSPEDDELVWKSSSIAPLFHRLDVWTIKDLRLTSKSEMDLAVEKMKVQLTGDHQDSVSFVRC